ncbi:MAG: beta-N-acetylhexosaminidase [Deltaproteobacteria bacterium]|nr:beta-N-acetylhexosaminidase [Deltaproteobacteria bacterium]MBW1874442.1 beta-N-acetylhexosaminidase [Deltaproteobacteria bacterium]MBW2210607.1 beta-N-acetylhexosaminidase [Deltaproteobacteria bacterium]MBW2214001.1 beta-N-acetylhexosaminidase [Deltaproteobacteria bacterium]MBW2378235.1 beta-N-acetylhexosaminidase [Deltaproteobacteria bacterium]
MNELERMAGNVIVCGFSGLEAPATVHQWLAQQAVAGLILFKRNIDDVDRAAALIASCTARQDPDLPILICVDQEGGRVARFGDPLLRLPPMRTLAAVGDMQLTRDAAMVLGRQLRAIGVNLDFAPVLDVDTNPQNPVIGDRAFGRTPDVVIQHALAFADGLRDGGVLSCGKHFPGHGDTDVDSHLSLPTLRHDRARLDQVELRPFHAAAKRIPSLMTAHVVFEAVDSDVPATMSQAAIGQLLREEIGFEGAVFSDDLEMKAVTERYAIEEAGVLAIEAGCDLLLVCSDLEAAARVRETLATEAGRSKPFRARLADARSRADILRRRIDDLPPPVPLQNALESAEAQSVKERLGRYLVGVLN